MRCRKLPTTKVRLRLQSRLRRILDTATAGMLGKQTHKSLHDTIICLPLFTHVLAFGSPGRWLATLMLKMISAYVFLNYDIEATAPPASMRVIGDAVLPPMSATIKVRRRKAAKA